MYHFLKRNSSGFSLVELLIGLTITMLIVGAFIDLFIRQNKSYSSESLRQEMNLNGRIGLDEIPAGSHERRYRPAGSFRLGTSPQCGSNESGYGHFYLCSADKPLSQVRRQPET